MGPDNDDDSIGMNDDKFDSNPKFAAVKSEIINRISKRTEITNDMGNLNSDNSEANMSDIQDEKKNSDYESNSFDGTADDYFAEKKMKMKQEDSIDDFIDDDGFNPNFDDEELPKNESGSTTVINGRGIWHSWTRNFSTPLLALLDLLDNAFDATTLKNRGRIHIEPDLCMEKGLPRGRTTGLILWNNSFAPIKPLHKVLEVYTSLKGSHADSIGENGVGLKQGCATLSNLCFCLVKSNSNQYSLGVIAYRLQTSFGCSLPAFTFESSTIDGLRREMINKFTNENPAVGECIIQYGTMDAGGHQAYGGDSSSKASLLRFGVDRLLEKFQKMNQGGWEQFPHIFCLVVDHLKHGEKAISTSESDGSFDQQIRVNKLLETLYVDLPKRYLHIPTTLIDVRVGFNVVNFNFWQPRLVEMAQFDLKIYKSANMVDVFNARASEKYKLPPKQKDSDDNDEVDNENVPRTKVRSFDDDPSQVYTLRIYTGFDALRVCDERAQKTAAMYIYSRHSGRLIKANLDCRGELGLTSGGTDYCQGLTLIVDDYNAKFPLNPTKQDVAFGEQSNGETHKRNLYMGLNAAVRMYYMFYKDRVCNKQKRVLTEALKMMEPKVLQLIEQEKKSTSFQSLSDCEFITFGEFCSNSLMHTGHAIRLLPFKSVEYFLGKDSKLSLPAVPNINVDEDYDRPKKRGRKASVEKSRTPSSAKKPPHRSVSVLSANDSDSGLNNDMDDDQFLASLTQKSMRSPHDDSDDDIHASLAKKHRRRRTISESKLPDPVKKTRKSDGSDRMSALEEENRQLKKAMHLQKTAQDGNIKKSQHNAEILKKENKALQTEVSKQKVMIKQLQTHIKQLEEFNNKYSDDISLSRSSLNSGGDSKMLKKLKNLKSSFDVLKTENDDLKEQIRGLESTVKRKDKTIQAQRKVIDQRNKEDDEEANDIIDLGSDSDDHGNDSDSYGV